MKQLEEDPWETASRAFNVGDTVSGKVSSLTDYGAFIDLGNNIEGLVHMSELSWTNKNIHPSKVLQNGQDVNVVVLGIDQDKRRISLGYKQLQPNPWKQFAETHNVGDVITGPIKNTTEFGLFVALTPELDGMVHISDLSWNKLDEEELKKFVRGQEVSAKILDINPEKERVTLGIKQLTESAENNAVSSEFADDQSGKVEDTVESAEENAAATEETSASVVEVTSIVADIADKANGLNAIAEELEEKIGIFQL